MAVAPARARRLAIGARLGFRAEELDDLWVRHRVNHPTQRNAFWPYVGGVAAARRGEAPQPHWSPWFRRGWDDAQLHINKDADTRSASSPGGVPWP